MIINLHPQVRSERLAVSKAGDVLTINDESFDFSALPNGSTIPAAIWDENQALRKSIPCPWIIGDVVRHPDGQLELTLLFPCRLPPNYILEGKAPIIDPPDGAVVLPYDEEAA